MMEARACNLCRHFQGYGIHWFSGKCGVNGREIDIFNYASTAKYCLDYSSDFISPCTDCTNADTCKEVNAYMVACSKHKNKEILSNKVL